MLQEFLASLLDMLHEDLNQGSQLPSATSPSHRQLPRAAVSARSPTAVGVAASGDAIGAREGNGSGEDSRSQV